MAFTYTHTCVCEQQQRRVERCGGSAALRLGMADLEQAHWPAGGGSTDFEQEQLLRRAERHLTSQGRLAVAASPTSCKKCRGVCLGGGAVNSSGKVLEGGLPHSVER